MVTGNLIPISLFLLFSFGLYLRRKYWTPERLANKSINYIKKTHGKDIYNSIKGDMAEQLKRIEKVNGPDVADFLAKNPKVLVPLVIGHKFLDKEK